MPRVKQFDREEVLSKAMELFWKKGFHATSIQDLVDYIGINRASMYDTYGGKDLLFKEALELYRRKGSSQFKKLEGELNKKTARAFLENFFAERLKEAKEDSDRKGCMMVNTTTELSNQSKPVDQVLCNNMDSLTEIFHRIILIAQSRNEIPAHRKAETLARQLFTFFNGLQVVVKLEKDPDHLKEVVDLELDYIFS